MWLPSVGPSSPVSRRRRARLASRALSAPGWPEGRREGASRRTPRTGGRPSGDQACPQEERPLSALSSHSLAWSTPIWASVQKRRFSKAAPQSQFRSFTFLIHFNNSFVCFPFFNT